jgi:hypothetical protein
MTEKKHALFARTSSLKQVPFPLAESFSEPTPEIHGFGGNERAT